MPQRLPTPLLFPYTTLFRSPQHVEHDTHGDEDPQHRKDRPRAEMDDALDAALVKAHVEMFRVRARLPPRCRYPPPSRSEEHTSELQSLTNLVCRLLLENKKH